MCFKNGAGRLDTAPVEVGVGKPREIDLRVRVHMCTQRCGSHYMGITGWMSYKYRNAAAAAVFRRPHVVSCWSQSAAWRDHISAWLPENEEISCWCYFWRVFALVKHEIISTNLLGPFNFNKIVSLMMLFFALLYFSTPTDYFEMDSPTRPESSCHFNLNMK